MIPSTALALAHPWPQALQPANTYSTAHAFAVADTELLHLPCLISSPFCPFLASLFLLPSGVREKQKNFGPANAIYPSPRRKLPLIVYITCIPHLEGNCHLLYARGVVYSMLARLDNLYIAEWIVNLMTSYIGGQMSLQWRRILPLAHIQWITWPLWSLMV